MKVTLSWLKEFVDVQLSAAEIAHSLTMAGLEVESVAAIDRPFSGVVVGRILSCEPHPKADKLKLCRVDAGRGEALEVVCGAPNAAAGMLAPLALPGARLGEALQVELREIRGILSHGMLCSEAELGLTDRSEGLMVLDESARPGQDLGEWLGAPDSLFDIFVTPNRPDCLSVIGLARELAAVSGAPFHVAPIQLPETIAPGNVRVTIRNPELAPRYSGRSLDDLVPGASPFWMAYRLHHAGMRAINNIVDITNYVMLETGHPLHAFDARQIEGGEIIVRAASPGESFTTLDGKVHTLDAETCLICDAQKPVALAGIMGGLNSEVRDDTRRIFLESAYFTTTTVRRAGKRLGISTESSRRFERGADPEATLTALNRAAALLLELAGARLDGAPVDAYPEPIAPVELHLPLNRVNALLGTSLDLAAVAEILARLEIRSQPEQGEGLCCQIPSFRPDLTRPVDLIEEVARIHGYDRIPFARTVALDQSQQANPRITFQDQLRSLLAGYGLRETLSLSMVSPAACGLFLPAGAGMVELLNPLSAEWSVFRSSLLISLLNNAAYNRNRQNPNLRFFEIGNAAWRMHDQFIEVKQVAGLLVGESHEASWHTRPRPVDFYDIKGIVLALLQELGIGPVALGPVEQSCWGQESAALLLPDGRPLGVCGRLAEPVLQNFKIKNAAVYGFQLDFALLFEQRRSQRKFVPIPRFPHIPFDLALLLDVETPVGAVEAAIWNAGGPHLVKVHLFDHYLGEQVPSGKKSIAFSLNFSSKERTLGEEEVERYVADILTHLAEHYGVELRPR